MPYPRQGRDNNICFVMLACAAITASIASNGMVKEGNERPSAEPELYMLDDRKFEDVYLLAEQAPPLGSGECACCLKVLLCRFLAASLEEM